MVGEDVEEIVDKVLASVPAQLRDACGGAAGDSTARVGVTACLER